jgi:hypothetical protein
LARKRDKKSKPVKRSNLKLRVRQIPDETAWELLHPRCALDREEDIEEVQEMLQGDETEIAVDELRWLLAGCGDFIRAHRMLGELALAEGDVQLARGHFGHGYGAAVKVLKKAGMPTPLPYSRHANQDFFECGKGLLRCLRELGKEKMAAEVARFLLQCDPADPLAVRQARKDDV